MGSHKRVRLYAENKLQRSNRSVFTVILDNEDKGYWKHPNEMMCFFHKKITENELDWYEEIEVTKEECKELFELLTKAKELHEQVIGGRWSRFDSENKEHCKVYDAIAKMFYFDKYIKKDYNGYNIGHLFNEYDFFENLVEKIRKTKKNKNKIIGKFYQRNIKSV